jgi:hypothetical protein
MRQCLDRIVDRDADSAALMDFLRQMPTTTVRARDTSSAMATGTWIVWMHGLACD